MYEAVRDTSMTAIETDLDIQRLSGESLSSKLDELQDRAGFTSRVRLAQSIDILLLRLLLIRLLLLPSSHRLTCQTIFDGLVVSSSSFSCTSSYSSDLASFDNLALSQSSSSSYTS